MATYLTTYSAGLAKLTTSEPCEALMAAGNHDPADANAGPWDPALDPDTGHDSAADKHITERVPWDVPLPAEDNAEEDPPEGLPPPEAGVLADPPVGQTAIEGERA